MAGGKVIAQESTKDGKLSPGMLFTPTVAQWTLVAVLLVLFGLSRTRGTVGAFLRSFSAFLFP